MKEVQVKLQYNGKSHKLEGHVLPCEESVPCSREQLLQLIAQSDYAQFFILEKNIEKLLKAYRDKKKTVVEIAEKRDYQAEITVSEDSMSVHLNLVRAYGGNKCTYEDLKDKLLKEGVVEGILSDNIHAAVAEEEVEAKLIAQGREPTHGEDTRFECLIKECLFKGPKIDDSGKVDFFDLQEFILVDPDTPVMQRTAATEGEGGYDVHGQPIPAKPGKEIPFREEEGVRPNPSDPDILLAATKGHPVIYADGVKVDPTLKLARVDLSTGNVNFDGSLYVKGDIADNMTVNVTGNVLVDGVIQKAHIKAGGDIMVKNGVIGGAVLHTEDDVVQHYGAHLQAEGDIQARFIDNAHLEAGNLILVREYIRHSLSTAGKKVLLGKQGGKGQLIGGKTTATQLVEAKLMGTQADVHTYVEVGIPPRLRMQYDNLSNQIFKKNHEMTGLITSFGFLKSKRDKEEAEGAGAEKAELVKVAQSIKEALAELEQLNKERDALEAKMQEAINSYVEAQRGVYRNLTVKIKDTQFKVNEQCTGGKFTLTGKKIEFTGRVCKS